MPFCQRSFPPNGLIVIGCWCVPRPVLGPPLGPLTVRDPDQHSSTNDFLSMTLAELALQDTTDKCLLHLTTFFESVGFWWVHCISTCMSNLLVVSGWHVFMHAEWQLANVCYETICPLNSHNHLVPLCQKTTLSAHKWPLSASTSALLASLAVCCDYCTCLDVWHMKCPGIHILSISATVLPLFPYPGKYWSTKLLLKVGAMGWAVPKIR